ncbi:hypothetical protein LTR84_008782 [Exophiala bonariae]|uniref:Carboxylic ester hydrolase n=1 Tax=Exophiala bonariae TaxID=1690606 RepID=A0AAV9MZH7_9EURO|nr:hypothetical protein LTR84_008782 [Exophiala bonariae]
MQLLCPQILILLSAIGNALAILRDTGSGVSCESSAFDLPEVLGTRIISLRATPIFNDSLALDRRDVPDRLSTLPGAIDDGLDYCNVSLTYTHPGLNDSINVAIWLPLKSHWNGRFMGVGGGGFNTGYSADSSFPYNGIGANFSTMWTSGGHVYPTREDPFPDPAPWGLASPGVVDFNGFNNFASLTLHEATLFGKAITENYYGRPAEYSYWNGCSQGGRQGHMFAQRYPDMYDGILGAAAAINWVDIFQFMLWPQIVMNQEGQFPSLCELEAIKEAAIEACDELDGLKDGLISANSQCTFDANEAVGRLYNCSGEYVQVSAGAAQVANAAWRGPLNIDGTQQWYGTSKDTDLSPIANTTISSNGTREVNPLFLPHDWIRVWIAKDATYKPALATYEDFDHFFHTGHQIYDSPIGTVDPDLRAFRDAGGKFLTWHGVADAFIPFDGTVDYYNKVLQRDPSIDDYYRFFPVPGIGHCGGGPGAKPDSSLETLVNWVEKGIAPETLLAMKKSTNGSIEYQRPLCRYPFFTVFVGSDPNLVESYECRESF